MLSVASVVESDAAIVISLEAFDALVVAFEVLSLAAVL